MADIKTMIPAKNIKEAEDVLKLISSMNEETQKSFYQFLQGVKFGQALPNEVKEER